jgi:hypothetical protein
MLRLINNIMPATHLSLLNSIILFFHYHSSNIFQFQMNFNIWTINVCKQLIIVIFVLIIKGKLRTEVQLFVLLNKNLLISLMKRSINIAGS